MAWMAVAASCGAVALTLAAAWTDWRRREVPNALLAALVGLWLLAVPTGLVLGSGGTWPALACGAAGLALGFGLYALGAVGAGDGKLLGALGLWLGPSDAAFALLAAAVLMLGLLVPALTRGRAAYGGRGIPVACALAPPTAVVLATRAAVPGLA